MKAAFSKARILIVIAAVILLVLAFPSKLYAKDIPVVQQNSKLVTADHHSRMILASETFGLVVARTPERGNREFLMIDEDTRVRTATALGADSVIKGLAPELCVPVRMIVITAPLILDA